VRRALFLFFLLLFLCLGLLLSWAFGFPMMLAAGADFTSPPMANGKLSFCCWQVEPLVVEASVVASVVLVSVVLEVDVGDHAFALPIQRPAR
jgi:hypothetical protein